MPRPQIAVRNVNILDHVRVPAAVPDTLDAWLHPCGWTRQEPYGHLKGHAPCAPIDELVQSFDDMWPIWRSIVAPFLSLDGEQALDRLATRLHQLGPDAYRDAIESLEGEQCADVRELANETLASLLPS